jgi:putative ABC transport system substrate-binding protein
MAALADTYTYPPERLQTLQELTRQRGVELSVYRVSKPEEIAGAIEAAKNSGALALNVLASLSMWVHRRIIRERVALLSLPAMYQFPEMAEEGGLIAYGTNIVQVRREIVPRQAAALLRGAKVADVPVEQPSKFDLVINLKTAKALGLSIPESFLLRADEVIE